MPAWSGADRDVILQDLLSISERFEVPGGFVEGLQIFLEADEVSIVPNHFLRPMRLTRSELLALELGLTMLRGERPPEEHRAIAGAMARLEQAVAGLPGAEIADDVRIAELSPSADLEHLRRLRQAFRDRRKVRLTLPEGRRLGSRRTGSSARTGSCSPAGCGTRWPIARAARGSGSSGWIGWRRWSRWTPVSSRPAASRSTR